MKEITLILVVLCLGVIVGINFRSCDEHVVTGATTTVIKRDTLYAIVPETCYVYRKAATVRIIDTVTIVASHPFIATQDTVLDKVAIRDTFFFPQRTFGTRLTRLADSVRYEERTHLRVDTLVQSSNAPTWQQTAIGAIGIFVGFLIGRGSK